MKLLITEILYNDIFGQRRGTYLSEERRQVNIKNEGAENQILYLNEGNSVVVDFMMLKNLPNVGDDIETNNFILSSYAKNPQMGVVVIITGKAVLRLK